MKPLRVGIVCDFLEEQWPSMDLVADRLITELCARDGVDPVRMRPALQRRLSRLPLPSFARGDVLDRVLNRHVDYARWLARQPPLDLYHVVDHSYAHLVHRLPAERTVVTCHDLDAFRSLFPPVAEARSPAFRYLARRTMSGLRRAARVLCDSRAVRDELVAGGVCNPERIRIAPLGVDLPFSAEPDDGPDRTAAALADPGRLGRREILHVGSTIPRKRIDVLLRMFAAVVSAQPDVVLVRPGGLTEVQRDLARDLGITAHVIELPFVDSSVLAALYRRAAVVVIPSDREGFGLPVLEALACGAPVVASDLPVLREVGGGVVTFSAPGDVAAFTKDVLDMLRGTTPSRRADAVAHAARFTWRAHATAVEAVYRELAG